MKKTRKSAWPRVALAALAINCLLCFQADAQSDGKLRRSQRPVTNHYIVVLKDDAGDAEIQALADEVSRTRGGAITHMYTSALKGFAVQLSETAAIALSLDPRVDYVEEAGKAMANAIQAGPPWGLDRIDQRDPVLDLTYSYNAQGSGVNVYVIDSGIYTGHSEFGTRAIAVFGGGDCYGHGTHVAGIIGGSTYGVAKRVNLYGLQVFDCAGNADTPTIIQAIDWVIRNTVHPAVINMSLQAAPSDALDTEVRNAIKAGIICVVAAGNGTFNDGIATDAGNFSPARVTEAITVGATDTLDSRASYSNYGSVVDLFAPGGMCPATPCPPGQGILSAWIGGPVASMVLSGTSMAAPHVTGAVALYLETHPFASPSLVQGFIVTQATRGRVTNPGPGSPNLLLYSDPGAVPWNLWSMGYNNSGQLGTGAVTFNSTVPIPAAAVPPLFDVSAGMYHSLGIGADGSVWSWGSNVLGELGNGTTTSNATPARVPGFLADSFASVWAGPYYSLALQSDGTLWAWGDNSNGQLGDGTTTNSLVPKSIWSKFPAPVVAISGAATSTVRHSLAITADGAAWAWGNGAYGDLGNGTYTDSTMPVPVAGGGTYLSVAGGDEFSVGLRSDGTVWTWGSNSYGTLGTPNVTCGVPGFPAISCSLVPVQVTDLPARIVAVAVGASHTLALSDSGLVYSWGDNAAGDLGDGTTTQRHTPVLVSGLSNVATIAASLTGSMAVKRDGTVWAWGSNAYYGDLGLGALTEVHVPTLIAGLPAANPASLARMFLGHSHVMVESNAAAPALSLNPLGLNFGNQVIGTVSAPQTVTATNNSAVPVFIRAVSAGTNFLIQINTCSTAYSGKVLAPNASCTVTVKFAPFTRIGSINEVLEFVDDSTGSPETVALSGAGVGVISLFTITPSVVDGGNSVTGTIVLTAPAPAPGVTITIASNSGAVIVPPTVTVVGINAFFNIRTVSVKAPTLAVVTVSAPNNPTAQAPITVNPAVLSSLTVAPAVVVGPSPATGTVTLAAPAPPGGVAVTLASNSVVAKVPATVTVLAGATSATFSIGTLRVVASTPVSVSATIGGPSIQAPLTVNPAVLSGLTIAPVEVPGGMPATGTVTLAAPAPLGGVVVTLAEADNGHGPDSPAATVPATITVPAGATSATFPITTSPVRVGILAIVKATLGGLSTQAPLTVDPAALSSLTIAPATVRIGSSATGTITLTAPAPHYMNVALSSDSFNITLPFSVTVPTGASSATFSIRPGYALGTVNVTATLGAASITATFTVQR